MADKEQRPAGYGAIPSHVRLGIGASTPPLSPLMLHVDKNTNALKGWEFPGWGDNLSAVASESELNEVQAHLSVDHPKLSEWLATAICGNDILSSCLYVSGLVASKAGKLAPVALAIVAGILYLYRFIYGEVLNAVPLNGGSYNVLLNTTSKRVAAMAASLAILSYIATGVVSGTSACNYLASHVPSLEIVPATIGLLFIFAMLSLIGITESAVVALVIFIAHATTLAVLCVLSAVYVWKDGFQTLHANFITDFPDINLAGDIMSGNFLTAIFFGTSTAMLGISGFETSSQFVEEQAEGVFPKTLRNMWWGVAIFNPMISLLSLGVLPLDGPGGIVDKKNTVLAEMGLKVAGETMQLVVALDAFIVLSGAVLTAYVGVVGLLRLGRVDGGDNVHGQSAGRPDDPHVLFALLHRGAVAGVHHVRADLPAAIDEDETHSLRTGARGGQTIARFIREINEPAVFFFCKTPNLNVINKAILYVRTNEQTHTLYIVHCHPRGTPVPEGFKETVSMFDHVYLKIKLNFLSVEGPFGPAMVEWVSRKYSQPKNLMFIKQPNHDFAHTIASLGGVRVITGRLCALCDCAADSPFSWCMQRNADGIERPSPTKHPPLGVRNAGSSAGSNCILVPLVFLLDEPVKLGTASLARGHTLCAVQGHGDLCFVSYVCDRYTARLRCRRAWLGGGLTERTERG
ncbi:hypothetical protein ON010_g14269 [Phytophthora cinnamomi]|nr:hypothetical protein ON010_g14269 [Phytophthora cinnamomi]